MFDQPTEPTCVHHFVEEHAVALQHAAFLLGGTPWLKRIKGLFEALRVDATLHGRVGRELAVLHELFTLIHAHEPSRPEADYFAALDPSRPHLEEIETMADELWKALQKATHSPLRTEGDAE